MTNLSLSSLDAVTFCCCIVTESINVASAEIDASNPPSDTGGDSDNNGGRMKVLVNNGITSTSSD
jgi:hypothetical protein